MQLIFVYINWIWFECCKIQCCPFFQIHIITLTPSIRIFHCKTLELVTIDKYPGLIIDGELSFRVHVQNVISNLRVKLAFYYRNKSCFSFLWSPLFSCLHLIMATFEYVRFIQLFAVPDCSLPLSSSSAVMASPITVNCMIKLILAFEFRVIYKLDVCGLQAP